MGRFKAIVLQQARYYSLDLRFFKLEIPRNRSLKLRQLHFSRGENAKFSFHNYISSLYKSEKYIPNKIYFMSEISS